MIIREAGTVVIIVLLAVVLSLFPGDKKETVTVTPASQEKERR